MADGETVETVWMPDGDGGERGDGSQAAEEEETEDRSRTIAQPTFPYRRSTICISSQVGCAVNCQFCLTAKLGIRRNLTPGEIAGQVAAVLNRQNVELGSSRGNPTPAASTSSSWAWANPSSTTTTSSPPSACSPRCRFPNRA